MSVLRAFQYEGWNEIGEPLLLLIQILGVEWSLSACLSYLDLHMKADMKHSLSVLKLDLYDKNNLQIN